jgi:hypothetical protein
MTDSPKKPENPPAFPGKELIVIALKGEDPPIKTYRQIPGMTLWDWYMGKALSGRANEDDVKECIIENCAKMADLALAERAKRGIK